jgi:hypothetical protein
MGVYVSQRRNNTIAFNEMKNNNIGIYLSTLYNHCDNCFSDKIEFNNFGNNSDFNFKMYNHPSNITTENNWWGTTNESEIESKIWDFYDDSSLGIVDFNPYLCAPFHENQSSPCGYIVDNNTAALWHFNEGSGSTVHDETGMNNGAIFGAAWTDGRFGNALNFDGYDDYVVVPDDNSLDITSQGTLEAWINSKPGGTGYAHIISKAMGNGAGQWTYHFEYNVPVYGGRLRIAFSQGGRHCQEVIGNTPVNDNNWHHVAATWNGTEINIYVDGILDVSAPQTCSPWVTTHQLQIGHLPNTPDYFSGVIDEVRISNKARNPSEFNV